MTNKEILFSIVSKCTEEIHQKSIISSVRSIRKYYPKAEIVVVDSDSQLKSHFRILKLYGCTIEDIGNTNYEFGAMWYVYEKYPRECYFFLQDSMILKTPIDQYLDQEICVINFFDGWENSKEEHKNWAKEVLKDTDYSYVEEDFKMVQYQSFIIKRYILDKLKDKKLNLIKPIIKNHSEAMERIIGIALTEDGYFNNPKNLNTLEDVVEKVWYNRQ
jgi:hypothetical protein